MPEALTPLCQERGRPTQELPLWIDKIHGGLRCGRDLAVIASGLTNDTLWGNTYRWERFVGAAMCSSRGRAITRLDMSMSIAMGCSWSNEVEGLL